MTILGIILLGICLQVATGFRGPHHPRGGVSHHHHTPQREVKLTQDSQLLHDTEHLMEDLGDFAEQMDISKMTDQQLDFYYFKAHDTDNNTKLDGLEMLHAIQHSFHEDDDDHHLENSVEDQMPLIIELIDRVLQEDDLDKDGYLGYIEYVLARQKTGNDMDKARKELKLEI